MKKYSFLAAVILFAASCTGKSETTDKAETEDKTETTTITETKAAVVKDPVCGMEKDNTWTEYSVNGTDTTWFCSPHCKETFAKKQTTTTEEKKG